MIPFDKLSPQCQRVLAHVDKHGSINPQMALTECGIMRLAPRIMELERAGYPFRHEMVDSVNRFGEKVRFMEYTRAVDIDGGKVHQAV